jgi:hypothetical protein
MAKLDFPREENERCGVAMVEVLRGAQDDTEEKEPI